MQFGQLKRRDFVTLLGGAAAAWPLEVHAQQAAMQLVAWRASEECSFSTAPSSISPVDDRALGI
jgi:hypothetical protein